MNYLVYIYSCSHHLQSLCDRVHAVVAVVVLVLVLVLLALFLAVVVVVVVVVVVAAVVAVDCECQVYLCTVSDTIVPCTPT